MSAWFEIDSLNNKQFSLAPICFQQVHTDQIQQEGSTDLKKLVCDTYQVRKAFEIVFINSFQVPTDKLSCL